MQLRLSFSETGLCVIWTGVSNSIVLGLIMNKGYFRIWLKSDCWKFAAPCCKCQYVSEAQMPVFERGPNASIWPRPKFCTKSVSVLAPSMSWSSLSKKKTFKKTHLRTGLLQLQNNSYVLSVHIHTPMHVPTYSAHTGEILKTSRPGAPLLAFCCCS